MVANACAQTASLVRIALCLLHAKLMNTAAAMDPQPTPTASTVATATVSTTSQAWIALCLHRVRQRTIATPMGQRLIWTAPMGVFARVMEAPVDSIVRCRLHAPLLIAAMGPQQIQTVTMGAIATATKASQEQIALYLPSVTRITATTMAEQPTWTARTAATARAKAAGLGGIVPCHLHAFPTRTVAVMA